MAIHDQVAIMRNGNMDSQSWFHSQINELLFLKYKLQINVYPL
jgi:hypothetical protein